MAEQHGSGERQEQEEVGFMFQKQGGKGVYYSGKISKDTLAMLQKAAGQGDGSLSVVAFPLDTKVGPAIRIIKAKPMDPSKRRDAGGAPQGQPQGSRPPGDVPF